MSKTRTDFDIIVIGGGIVGACTAALFAADPTLAALRIALIEAQLPSLPPEDEEVALRVSAFSRASERILHSFGAWPSIAPNHLSPYSEMVVWDAEGKPRGAGSIHFSAGSLGEPNLGHIVENRRVQSGIYGSSAFRERVTLLHGELAAMELLCDRAAITLADGRRYSALLAVGADGPDSASRKLAGIETDTQRYPQSAFVTHVRTQRPHESTAWQRFLSGGPLAFLPLADGRSSIVWATQIEHAQRLVADPAVQVEQALREAIGDLLGEVRIAGPRGSFPLRMMHARSYCRDRFVLVGDAAHTVHPLAGQGVNLGLLDCASLTQTLAAELSRGGPLDAISERRVLRRYERWRKSENTLALGFIDGLNRLFGAPQNTVSSMRRWGLDAVDRTAPLKKFLMSRAMGTAGELPRLARPIRDR